MENGGIETGTMKSISTESSPADGYRTPHDGRENDSDEGDEEERLAGEDHDVGMTEESAVNHVLGAVPLTYPYESTSSTNSQSYLSAPFRELVVGTPQAGAPPQAGGERALQNVLSESDSDFDSTDGSDSSFNHPVGLNPAPVPGQARRRRLGVTTITHISSQSMKLDPTYVTNRAYNFLQLCQKPFFYRRARHLEEHSQAWQEVQEDLDSIKKDDFMATFVARKQDDEGSSALHYVCRGRPPIHVVESLLEVSGRPVKRRDKEGNLPLHLAAKYGTSYDVLRAVLNVFPEGANMKNNAGRLPVLLALMSNAQPRIVDVLNRQMSPSHRQEIDDFLKAWKSFQTFVQHRFRKHRRTPTPNAWIGLMNAFMALRNNHEHPHMAEWIIEHVDDDEDTPFHIACGLCPPVDCIKTMIEVSRTPLGMQNAWGGLPLHYALLRGSSDSVTILLCKEYPEAIGVCDDFGSYPLHYALRNGATFPVIEALLDGFPEACGQKDNEGCLPLHVAAITGAPDQVLQSLVDRYPKATRSRDNNGSLPVHHAVRRYSSREVIKILEKVNPVEEETSRRAREFLEECDVYGIVHPKAMRRSTIVGQGRIQRSIWAKVRDEIESLSQDSFLAEEIATYSDEYGNTPLHVVCMSRPPIDVVKSLIKMSTTPLYKMKNEHEWLPLHCAIRYGASYDVVKVLLDASPESSKVKNEQGKLPFRMAVELNATAKVKKILFEADVTKSKEIEDVSRRALEFRRMCTIARHENKQHSRDYDPNQAWQAVRNEVFELQQEASIAKRVAEYPDKDTGMTALHIVCGSPDPPPDVVKLLIEMSKEPLRMRSKRERLPLHIVLDTGASDDVLKLLLKAHPEDTKKEDLHDEHLRSLRTALMLGASVEVIKLLTDASPVPVSDEGITFFESLEIYSSQTNPMLSLHQSSIRSCSQQSKESVSQFQEELMDPGKGTIRISEETMKVLMKSFLDEYQRLDFGGAADDEEVDSNNFDEEDEEVPLVTNFVSFHREALMGEKNHHREKYVLIDRFFSFLRKMPTNLKEEALFHPSLHDMLNKMIARRFFTSVLMADFFILITILVTMNLAVLFRSGDDNIYVSTAEIVVLRLCICYLVVRELVQILSYRDDGILSLWLRDLWNWLDISYIVLLFASSISFHELNVSGRLADAQTSLVMVTGGLSWIMLLVELRSTQIEFSVFTSGLINIARKLLPFLITTIILLTSFAFMFFADYHRSDVEQDCPPTEVVGLESGWHEVVVVDEPNFCTMRDSLLKVFTMMLAIDPGDFTGGGQSKVWLAIVFACLFIIILLNVLIAIVDDNWADVQRDGKMVFWRARYSFVNEVDSLLSWSPRILDFVSGRRRNFFRSCGWSKMWITTWCWCRAIFGFIGYALWLLAGLVSFGFLWDNSFREWLLCRKPTLHTDNLSNEMLLESLKLKNKEMGTKMDDMMQEMDSLKKQITMLLQEQRAQQASVTDTIGSLKQQVVDVNKRMRT